MDSLESKFEELLNRIGSDGVINSRSTEPIYYLVYPPQDILAVRRRLEVWMARLRREGWQPYLFSAADHIRDILAAAPDRELWLQGESLSAFHPETIQEMNRTLSDLLTQKGGFEDGLSACIETAQSVPKGLVLVSDLEALHPYFRIGVIEQHLQGKLRAPLVILYPGTGSGQYGLKFLGFYPEDGNYRSVHIGK